MLDLGIEGRIRSFYGVREVGLEAVGGGPGTLAQFGRSHTVGRALVDSGIRRHTCLSSYAHVLEDVESANKNRRIGHDVNIERGADKRVCPSRN